MSKKENRMQPEFRRRWKNLLILFLGLFVFLRTSAAENRMPAGVETTDFILAQARKSVELFWDQFRSVTCVETIVQEKLGKGGMVEYSNRSKFDYLVLMSIDKDYLSVDESRLEQGKKGKTKKIPLLVTNGIPTLLLVFHPLYRDNFNYRLEGEETSNGKRLVRIRFEHIPGTKSTTALGLRGRNYPLEIEGTAWIDPATGSIYRIKAGIGAPVGDLNLKTLEMDVQYFPYTFSNGEPLYWLPSAATIVINSERQQWRNVHRYSGYKRFTVNTEDVVRR